MAQTLVISLSQWSFQSLRLLASLVSTYTRTPECSWFSTDKARVGIIHLLLRRLRYVFHLISLAIVIRFSGHSRGRRSSFGSRDMGREGTG